MTRTAPVCANSGAREALPASGRRAVPPGLLASWALARQLSHLLFVVTPVDLMTSAVGSAVLVTAALLASAFPAVRAGATDPVAALRCE